MTHFPFANTLNFNTFALLLNEKHGKSQIGREENQGQRDENGA